MYQSDGRTPDLARASKLCKYCHDPIETDEPDWGFYFERKFPNNRQFYHTECIQQYEGIDLGDDDE